MTYLVNLNLLKRFLNVNDAISILNKFIISNKFVLQYFYRNFILHSKGSSKSNEAL